MSSQACASLDIEIISLRAHERLPFKLRPATLRPALLRGVMFEVSVWSRSRARDHIACQSRLHLCIVPTELASSISKSRVSLDCGPFICRYATALRSARRLGASCSCQMFRRWRTVPEAGYAPHTTHCMHAM